MLFSNPVKGSIHVSKLAIGSLVPANAYHATSAYWTRPSGNFDFAVTQFFGPTNVVGELKIAWPGGEGIAAASYPLFHIGVDVGNTRCGDPILAAAAGKVTTVGRDALGALYISIDHGSGFSTTYRHEATQLVKVGQIVAEGQPIAAVGNTSTVAIACHLHWEVYRNGHLVDGWARLKQNTSVDPDALPEAEMVLTKYLPLYAATIAKGFNVRTAPSTSGSVIRLTAGPESWTLLGVAKGESVNGSADWYVRVNGLAFEFVHSSGVSGVAAPPPLDCTAAMLGARQAQYDTDAKAIVLTPATAKLGNARPA